MPIETKSYQAVLMYGLVTINPQLRMTSDRIFSGLSTGGSIMKHIHAGDIFGFEADILLLRLRLLHGERDRYQDGDGHRRRQAR